MLFNVGTLLAVCVVAAAQLTTTVAVDYPGGWLPSPPRQQCVDICVNSNPAPTCIDMDPACLAKKQRPRDYDFLLLEQIFIPQFCRDLLKGVDSTMSHQNVNPYPTGVRCDPSAAEKNEMTIHGLWPNYNAGYASCCNVSDSVSNHPFHALEFAVEHLLLLTEMQARWVDPTQYNAYLSLCEIYNHEYQKHGVCYGAIGDNWKRGAATYFRAALNAASRHFVATQQLNNWAARKSPQTSLAAITALFPKKVQVLCSAVDGLNQLSAIRTCFEKPDAYGSLGPFVHRDCADASSSAAFVPCDDTAPITLLPYMAP
ncbi:hypothetical protein PybrP1_011888 [[Pythium] brassicae (nom. inval.)]|nr:hypothetical protein PybrP1_011888 [[Pythium] brassicae (nom. inval.)]